MTGIELMREKMLEKGMNKAQTTAKAVTVILEILAESQGYEFLDIWEKEKETEELEKRLDFLKSSAKGYAESALKEKKNYYFWKEKAENAHQEYIDKTEKLTLGLETEKNRIIADAQEYLKKFNEMLTACETEHSRDTLRTAQFFINNININTKYDNTAYITGLSTILSQGGIDSVEGLSKINSKLPLMCGRLNYYGNDYIYDEDKKEFVKTEEGSKE